MAEESRPEEIDLETFLKAAGQSFTDAQKALVPGLDVSVNMMLSNAELDLKVAVSSDVTGKMSIRPISSADIARGDIDPGMLSTLRISFVSAVGEIPQPPPAPPGGGTSPVNPVPDLVGLKPSEAAELLKAGGWQVQLHTAGSEQAAGAGKESRGRILAQEPAPGQMLDKTKSAIHLWVNLGDIPVKEIDGIGERLGESLSRIGITTTGELSLADIKQVSAALNISEPRARDFIDMAGMMSRLAIPEYREQVVELLVLGAGVRSMQELASTDPRELYTICQEAVSSGRVRVPKDFGFTVDDVNVWVKKAEEYTTR